MKDEGASSARKKVRCGGRFVIPMKQRKGVGSWWICWCRVRLEVADSVSTVGLVVLTGQIIIANNRDETWLTLFHPNQIGKDEDIPNHCGTITALANEKKDQHNQKTKK